MLASSAIVATKLRKIQGTMVETAGRMDIDAYEGISMIGLIANEETDGDDDVLLRKLLEGR